MSDPSNSLTESDSASGAPPDRQHAVILFVDLVGSVNLSDVLGPEKYDVVIKAFQGLVSDIGERVAKEFESQIPSRVDIDVRGDQLIFIATDPSEASTKQFAKRILEMAIALKLRWLCTPPNPDRIDDGLAPIGLGMGLHFGPVLVGLLPRFSRNKWGKVERQDLDSPEGFAINFAKRVESASRLGHSSGIILSQSMLALCRRAKLSIEVGNPMSIDVKGVEMREAMYELKWQAFYVPDFNRLATRLPGAQQDISLLCRMIKLAFRSDPPRLRFILESLLTYLLQRDEPELRTLGMETALDASKSEPDIQKWVEEFEKSRPDR